MRHISKVLFGWSLVDDQSSTPLIAWQLLTWGQHQQTEHSGCLFQHLSRLSRVRDTVATYAFPSNTNMVTGVTIFPESVCAPFASHSCYSIFLWSQERFPSKTQTCIYLRSGMIDWIVIGSSERVSLTCRCPQAWWSWDIVFDNVFR